jgi:hypothetical protein
MNVWNADKEAFRKKRTVLMMTNIVIFIIIIPDHIYENSYL